MYFLIYIYSIYRAWERGPGRESSLSEGKDKGIALCLFSGLLIAFWLLVTCGGIIYMKVIGWIKKKG